MKPLLWPALPALMLAIPPAPLAPVAHAAPKPATCMGRTTAGPATPRSFTIPVPPESVAAMAARGFVAQPCQGKENSVPKFRKEICGLAAAPASVQAGFQAVYGAAPAELCAMADSILGN